MAIVKKIITAHGGNIDFETESGKGTSFTIFLPKSTSVSDNFSLQENRSFPDALALQENKSCPDPLSLQEKLSVNNENNQKICQSDINGFTKVLKILMAEDNKLNQKLIGKYLDKMGHCVDIVSNGKEAVTALTNNQYDMVLMDIQMPEMDGLSATRVIRDISSPVLDHNILIMAMTGHNLQEEIDKCMDAGMNAHIAKPIKQTELAKRIADLTGSFKI
ncbi:MAG: response regulator [Desulfamplus sp.]|nr:response regulator [Desulfamplus sp.]